MESMLTLRVSQLAHSSSRRAHVQKGTRNVTLKYVREQSPNQHSHVLVRHLLTFSLEERRRAVFYSEHPLTPKGKVNK